jgi:hypothetical protein
MALTNEELLKKYELSSDPNEREELLSRMSVRDLFPSEEINYETVYGLYPDIDDKNFLVKLFHKREFAENKLTDINKLTTCEGRVEFEITPVQRFVANYLSGKTPYYSALIYHGVGVGKTCTAISSAEAFLNKFPQKKVYIIAPPNIQPNFKRTIFDINNVKISDIDSIPNSHNGCTGNLYLELTGTEFEKDLKVIDRKVKLFINSRYDFLGYIQLGNYIEQIKNRVSYIKDKSKRDEEIEKLIQREFSNNFMIIDEAHNLRDVPGEKDEDNFDAPGGINELSDSSDGKKLTPSLENVLMKSSQMKLLLLTATPMYNSYLEILFLLNLLLKNDKKATLKQQDIFNNDGTFKKNGLNFFGRVVNKYISYMRGESPKSFPIRLNPPNNVPSLESWPSKTINNEIIRLDSNIESGLSALPIVPVTFGEQTYDTFENIMNYSIENYGLSVSSIDTLIQSGNWIFPTLDENAQTEDRIRDIGFDSVFDETSHSVKNFTRFKSRIEPPTWLLQENLVNYSPKTAFILKQIRNAEGIIFIYSRFIKSGALPIALALEANGYTPYGKDRNMLYDGNQLVEGRQCALCSNRERKHNTDHEFIPAKYILLTGRKDISPNNNEMVVAERNSNNYDGREIKVVIGSQVASEGIDFKFIREIYVFDSWFHLNKMEQVLGRGIRTCSHIHPNIPKEKRNCTVYLLANTLYDNRETADLYMYRIGMIKALNISRINRQIKRYAIDCNLNYNGNVITGLKNEVQINAQRFPPKGIIIDINDKDYTNLCDYMSCAFDCVPNLKDKIKIDETDTITYDDYTARFRETQIKQRLKDTFENGKSLMIHIELIKEFFPEFPEEALFSTLKDIVNNKSFRLVVDNSEGYLTYRNGYYLFQPDRLEDNSIPLSLRLIDYPMRKDEYSPSKEYIIEEKPEINEEESLSIIQKLWKSILGWWSKITMNTYDEETISPTIYKFMKERFISSSLVDEYMKRLEMVIWLYKVMKNNKEYREILGEVLLGFVWDNFFNIQDQLNLLKNPDNAINKIANEQIVRGTFYRSISLEEPYKIQYYENQKQIKPAIIEVLNKDSKDPINQLPLANTKNTGKIYGFLVPKTKVLILKTANPVSEDNKEPTGGRDCRGPSSVKDKSEILYDLGKILKETIGNDFDLNNENLSLKGGKRKIESSNVYCALIELVLRWMDIKKVKNLRWFYRPISAYKTKHFGKIPKTKKM